MDAPPSKKTNWLPLLISALVSLGAVYLLFREVDLDELSSQIRGADYRWMSVIIITYPLSMLARAWRFKRIMKVNLHFWRCFHITNIGYLFNIMLPFRLGELVRVLLIRREPDQSAGAGLSGVSLERLFDLMFALTCVGVGLALLPESSSLPRETTSSLAFLILVTAVGIVLVLFAPRTHPYLVRLARFVFRPLPDAIGEKLVTFGEDTLESLRVISEPKRLLEVLFWSAMTWTTYVSFFYIGLLAFFENAPPIGMGFLVTGFVAVGIAAPSLPGAIGVFQAAAVLALTTAGYETGPATGYAWALWVSQTGVTLLGGVIGLSAMSLSFGGLRRDVQAGIGPAEEVPSEV
jgi:hypothetical protein